MTRTLVYKTSTLLCRPHLGLGDAAVLSALRGAFAFRGLSILRSGFVVQAESILREMYPFFVGQFISESLDRPATSAPFTHADSFNPIQRIQSGRCRAALTPR